MNESDAQQLHQSVDGLHELVLAQGERVRRLRLEAGMIQQKELLSADYPRLKPQTVQAELPDGRSI